MRTIRYAPNKDGLPTHSACGLMIHPTRFAEFNIVATSEGQLHRIAKVVFQNRDGSILLMFPSFAHNEGLVGELTMKAGKRDASYGLANYGKVAGHLVKYSHHPDGRAHFSQDGRVRTQIKRQSVPLDRQHSHMFTILVEDLQNFAPPRVNDKTPALILKIVGNPKAIKIVGRWYPLNKLNTFAESHSAPAAISVAFPDGKQTMGWFVAPPLASRYSELGLYGSRGNSSSINRRRSVFDLSWRIRPIRYCHRLFQRYFFSVPQISMLGS